MIVYNHPFCFFIYRKTKKQKTKKAYSTQIGFNIKQIRQLFDKAHGPDYKRIKAELQKAFNRYTKLFRPFYYYKEKDGQLMIRKVLPSNQHRAMKSIKGLPSKQAIQGSYAINQRDKLLLQSKMVK
jgi:hypothetical protein